MDWSAEGRRRPKSRGEWRGVARTACTALQFRCKSGNEAPLRCLDLPDAPADACSACFAWRRDSGWELKPAGVPMVRGRCPSAAHGCRRCRCCCCCRIGGRGEGIRFFFILLISCQVTQEHRDAGDPKSTRSCGQRDRRQRKQFTSSWWVRRCGRGGRWSWCAGPSRGSPSSGADPCAP